MKNEVLEMVLKYADRGITVRGLHGIEQDGSCICSRYGMLKNKTEYRMPQLPKEIEV